VSNDQALPFCWQHYIEHIVTNGQKVVLILGITVSSMYDGMLLGIRDRVVNLPEACDVVICYDAAIEKNNHEVWGNRTLIGLGGQFAEIVEKYPYLAGRCDIVLNDYSTAKFFPAQFPATVFNLIRPRTGIALLQDLTRKPLIVPFRIDDQTEPAHDSFSDHYDVMLLDGRKIRVSGIPRHPIKFTAAQLLLRVQTLSQSTISRDVGMIQAGRRIRADENLIGTRLSGSLFHLVQKLGLHFVDEYSKYFQVHQQYPYTPYPVVHQKQDIATGVWLLQPRIHAKLCV
jgi:hypothetical protein